MNPTLTIEAQQERTRVGETLRRTHPKPIEVKRTGITLCPDRSRVLVRPFKSVGEQLAVKVGARVMALAEAEVNTLLEQVLSEFGDRHQQISRLLETRFEQVRHYLLTDLPISAERKQLLGAYFTHEYALEAAALFNPSIVPHPDQSAVPPGGLRFVLSLRATGEGHISSVTFRTGLVDAKNQVTINKPTPFLVEPKQIPNATYEKSLFERKLYELALTSPFSRQLLAELKVF